MGFSSLIITSYPIFIMAPVEQDTISHIVSTEVAHDLKEEISEPMITRSKANEVSAPLLDPIIDDVEIPSAPIVTSEDLSVPAIVEPPNELEMMVSSFIDQAASYTLVRTALKTLDYGLDICEKYVSEKAPPVTKYVQKLRRYLRVVRHAGRRHARAAGGNIDNKKTRSLRDLPSRRKKQMREASLTGYFCDLFKVNFLLSYLGLELTFSEDGSKKHHKKSSGHETDDEESTVYKLMKEDEDYVPSGEESKESIEYNSEAEVSDDAKESQ